MPTVRPTAALALLAMALPLPAAAQERPREEDLFGAPPAAPAATRPGEAAPSPGAERPGEAEVLSGGEGAESRLGRRLGETENPLQIGGQLYLRFSLSSFEDQPPSRWTFSSPSLADVFLDARPTERVRGYGLARTFYDPNPPSGLGQLTQVGVTSAPGAGTARVALDQLWLSFDAARRVFVTVGKQHVKWGTGRFWNPTDFLHVRRRDPLAAFDDRGGTAMARASLPLGEGRGGLTAAAVVERLAPPSEPLVPVEGAAPERPAAELGAVGGAARAEVVLGTWELGADAVAQRGMRPRYGLDVSGGLWELDLRGEVAFRTGSDVPALRPGEETVRVEGVATPVPLPWRRVQRRGVWTQAVGSVEWSHKYSDEDTFTVGAEYFWNEAGYSDRDAYPVLAFWNAFTPFYLGRHYAAAFLLLPRPGSWNDTTFILTGIANLSDRSGVVRLDWQTTVLTHVRLEAFVQGHLGRRGGEFRFEVDVPPIDPVLPQGLKVLPPAADVGLALRVAL
ncbi:MAG TPA: hypothetical protein VFI16_01115 [Anaeromyxobacteraceae bacterium]|nr:hypothetical protein [Anaeromyxobacteraceae bacterium]